MKVGRDYSWWVQYSWECEYFSDEINGWFSDHDSGAMRLACPKKDIKKRITEHIIGEELWSEEYRNLKVKINDCYMTTPTEI